MYVTHEKVESAESMITEVERSQKTNANLQYNFRAEFWTDKDFKGHVFRWDRSGNAGANDNNKVRRNINLPSKVSNKVSSMKWTRSLDSDISKGQLRVYRNQNLNSSYSFLILY